MQQGYMTAPQKRLIEGLARKLGYRDGFDAWERWGWKNHPDTWPHISVRQASGIIQVLQMQGQAGPAAWLCAG